MAEKSIIEKIEEAGLTGRSGGGFPTHLKWQAVKQAKGKKKYVVCNGSEGEPGVFKDKYILENEPLKVIEGMKIALKELGAASGYLYLNPDYYQTMKTPLGRLISDLPIEIFKKPSGYLAGEETVLLNAIEGKALEPRLKPPFPSDKGLFGKPTLINNVETFYWISKIAKSEYKKERFYSIGGAAPNKGVFLFPENLNIATILRQSKNWPGFDFFVQTGGGASGEILLASELEKPLKGIGAIIIYNKIKTNPLLLMQKWVRFFMENNCDKCTPCREGIYRLSEILNKQKTTAPPANNKDVQTLKDVFLALEKTSLCPLGRIAVLPFKSALQKLF